VCRHAHTAQIAISVQYGHMANGHPTTYNNSLIYNTRSVVEVLCICVVCVCVLCAEMRTVESDM